MTWKFCSALESKECGEPEVVFFSWNTGFLSGFTAEKVLFSSTFGFTTKKVSFLRSEALLVKLANLVLWLLDKLTKTSERFLSLPYFDSMVERSETFVNWAELPSDEDSSGFGVIAYSRTS
jgi:hypothetical protein